MSTSNPASEALISVRALEKHFAGGSIRALNGVDADIMRGEVVVVIGPSGSGKSTFLRCLNLLDRPTHGQVIFEGVDIASSGVNINLHRQRMGMVFQHFNLFPGATGPRGPKGPRQRLPKPTQRRPEAACGHRARALHEAGRHAL